MSELPKSGGHSTDAGTLKNEVEAEHVTNPIRLPWGVVRERVSFPESVHISTSTKPGEFVLQTLFAEFTVLAEKKIEHVLETPNKEKPLSKLLQRGEDLNLDQLLSALNSVAENCLPALLRALFDWYDRQNPMDEAGNCLYRRTSKNRGEKEFLCEKRDLAVDFIYCLVLIEILKQLPYHPGHDDLVAHIISLAFRHFKYREGGLPNPNSSNINIVADLYAEVIGVLAQSRFQAVKKRFVHELRELRNKEQTQHTTQCIISLLMGMKFFRVKMHPIEEFQACIQFLHECGTYFLELKDKDKEIKHALAGLFVEILLPVAAVAKNEVNVPVLKTFVDMMYVQTLEVAVRRRHTLALFPMVTCLLCVSQKQFFLSNWPSFLTQCLLKLRDRDSTTARVALESLYRLLWVYMIRVKCESNTTTYSRLQSIVSSLFPKGAKVIVPKEAPLNIFVKIIQFIAQERLDFAMKEIIFDLLGVGKPGRPFSLYPERMCIGLRAFLVIADGRQQSEGEPPMPQTMGVLPSGSTLRFKKTFINRFLTDQTARNIGLSSYYAYVRKTFDSILRTLDAQVGRPILLIRPEILNRAADDIITGERKPKIDLFRYCIAALPRLLPDGLSQQELIEMISRLTVHIDDELGKLAFQSLQNISNDQPEWRNDVLNVFVHFILREVTDSFPQLLEQSNRRLIMLLTQWKASAQTSQAIKDKLEKERKEKNESNTTESATRGQSHQRLMVPERERNRATLHLVESLALVMMCSCKPVIRKQAVIVLKEVRNIFVALNIPKLDNDCCVLDMMDRACHVIVEKVLPYLPGPEKVAALLSSPVDFQWLTERTSIMWTCGNTYHLPASVDGESYNASTAAFDSASLSLYDSWIHSMTIFLHPKFVVGHCTTAIQYAWPFLFTRLQALVPLLDPVVIMNERLSSLLRSKKAPNERDMHLSLWKNYVVMGCCIAPPSHPVEHHFSSSDASASSPDTPDHFEIVASHPVSPGMTAREMFKSLTAYIKCEVMEMRETAVVGMGHINPPVFQDLLDELVPLIREAIDRKLDTRKKKRRDVIRLSLIHIFRLMAENAIFAQNSADVINPNTESLNSIFIEYIDGSRLFFELEADKDMPTLSTVRVHFSKFIHHLILNTPVSRRHKLLSQDLRAGLCMLFASWSGKFGLPFFSSDRNKHSKKSDFYSELEISALQACAASLCCGPVYDPAGLNEDGYIYVWLNRLLATYDEKIKRRIYKLVQETIVLLLEFNHDAQTLLEWVINRCYTGNHEIADGCFTAIAIVFNSREYPCDQVASLNLALLNAGCPRAEIQELAVQLLRLLYKRFFMDDVITDHTTDREDGRDSVFIEERRILREGLFSGCSFGAQMQLSIILAELHPDQTMPMFSEIMHRLVMAQPSVRQNLLQYLTPWLHNMELVDPNIVPNNLMENLTISKDLTQELPKKPLKGRGWGSHEATNMILNNLFYITLMLGNDHPNEIENLWVQLVALWPGNLQVVVRYIIISIGMYPQVLLPCAKKVIVYLARAKSELLVDELMNELRTAEPLPFNVERTETPPFYRLSKRQITTASVNDDEGEVREAPHLDKGQIHTKRHSAEDPAKLINTGNELMVLGTSAGSNSKMHIKSTSMPNAKSIQEDVSMCHETTDHHHHHHHHRQPHPLPMPAYGGYYAPLSELFPAGNLPLPPYHRSSLAVMLLPDLIMNSKLHIDWTMHLPLMLHMLFLGLDNNRPLVHEHCKKLLLSLLFVFPIHNDHFIVAKMIIGNRMLNEDSFLMLPQMFLGHDHDLNELWPSMRHMLKDDHVDNLTTDSLDCLPPVETFQKTDQVAKALVEFILTRKCRPLWAYEDITSKVHRIKSAESIEHLLKYVLRIFRDSLPSAHIEQRWAQESIHMALSCSSRHCAGRSFQVFRALHVSLNPNDLSDILSRLVETVAEQGDDMQGYVTEIMLTLEAAVDNLDNDLRPLLKDLCLSTPNLANEVISESRKMRIVAPLRNLGPPYRSSSCNQSSIVARKAIVSSPPVMENKESQAFRHLSGDVEPKQASNLSRSRSTQSLKHPQDPSGFDDRLTILSQMFWISVSMMESDFEYEFLLAVRLLDKVLKHLMPDRPDCHEKLDKILQMICWHDFPGVQALLLKGLTSPLTSESTWNLLSRMTAFISVPIVDQPSCEGYPKGLSIGFPLNVIALLPHLVELYDDRTKMCIDAANNIAEMCSRQSSRLENLATVMMQYSQGTFAKGCFQWTKCVVKYLYDVYSFLSDSMIAFLVEILDKGPTCGQGAVLQILHCLVHYIDITQASTQAINADLLRVVARYVENPHHWKEALMIIKLCVTRSSTLAAAPPNLFKSSLDVSVIGLPTQFPQTESKSALPGRTMEFKFDQNQIPIIGAKYWDIHSASTGSVEQMDRGSASIGTRHPGVSSEGTGSISTHTSSSEGLVSSWKRPVSSQARTRERLVNLLNCYGPRVIPKSPSETLLHKVVFDQQSPAGTLERASSITPGTSSDETSTIDGGMSGEMQIEDNGSVERQIQSVFDFLEETDSGCEYWGVNQRRSHSLDDEEEPGNHEEHKESSDEETQSTSPVEELHPEMPIVADRNNIPLDVSAKESICGSNQSIHSTCVDIDNITDMNEYSPCAASPSFITTVPYLQEDIVQAWQAHVNHVMAEFNSRSSVNTFILFYRLFLETKSSLCSLHSEINSYLTLDLLKDLQTRLSLLETMISELECPLVFVDAVTMDVCKLNEYHRFLLLEINECYDTYVVRQDKVIDSLEQIRSSLGNSPNETSIARLNLLANFYSLDFQLLHLYDSFLKLVNFVVQSAKSAEILDLSHGLTELWLELTQVGTEEQESNQRLRSSSIVSAAELDQVIVACVNAHQYSKAIGHAKHRALFHELGAVQPLGYIETVLYLYSRHLTESKAGYLAVCQQNTDTGPIYNCLIDIKVQVSSALTSLGHRVRSPNGRSITISKHSDSSTL